MKTKITEEQKQQIINLYVEQGLSYDKTSKEAGVSISTVRRILKNSGIKGHSIGGKKKEFTEEQINMIFDLYNVQGKSIHEIVNIMHSSTGTICRVLGSSVRKIGTPKKYSVNSYYFSNIDDEHKAYWLGVFYADGNITKEGTEKAIRFNSIDKEWVDMFIQDVEFTGTSHVETHKKYNKNIYCLRINDNQLHDDLNNLGCVPVKSKIIKFPEFLSEELIPHFIRGYFDGDGTVGIYKNSSKSNSYTLRSGFCSGSKTFIEKLITYLPCNNTVLKKRDNSDIWTIMYSVNDSIRLYNYMYRNTSVFLSRKKMKFEKFVQVRRSETIISPSYKDEGIVQS